MILRYAQAAALWLAARLIMPDSAMLFDADDHPRPATARRR